MDGITNGALNPEYLTRHGEPADHIWLGVDSLASMIGTDRSDLENELAFGLNFSRDTSSNEALRPWADLVPSRPLPLDVLLSDGRTVGPDSLRPGIEDVEYGRTGFGWW